MRTLSFVLALVLGLVLVAGTVAAQGTRKTSSKTTATSKATVEVVSIDKAAKTVTFKDQQGKATTLPAEGKGLQNIGALKTGKNMTLTFRDNAKGEHQAITNIKAGKTKKKK
jgi:hypothetical protein